MVENLMAWNCTMSGVMPGLTWSWAPSLREEHEELREWVASLDRRVAKLVELVE